MSDVITKSTPISLTVVIVLLGTAIAYGGMFVTVKSVDKRLTRIENMILEGKLKVVADVGPEQESQNYLTLSAYEKAH